MSDQSRRDTQHYEYDEKKEESMMAMTGRVEAYFGKIEKLTGEELDLAARELAGIEKQHIARLIAHLAEISRKRVHLEYGYKSLFEYCVRRLNLSEGSVWRRLQVAKVCWQFPQILIALSQNRLSLTAASLLAPHLSDENVERLIAEAENKTRRKVEEILVTFKPSPAFRPSIRRQPARSTPGEHERGEIEREDTSNKASDVGAPLPGTDGSTPSRAILEIAEPELVNFRFSARRAFLEKFERLAEVLGIENSQKQMAEIFEQALDIALQKKDPRLKLERRKKREARKREKQADASVEPCPGKLAGREGEKDRGHGVNSTVTRHIPSEIRERVFERADYRCEYRGPDGTRCGARAGLEIDHERPFAIHHSHDERFLRVLCRQHNLLTAEHVFGAEFINRKIESRRNQEAG